MRKQYFQGNLTGERLPSWRHPVPTTVQLSMCALAVLEGSQLVL